MNEERERKTIPRRSDEPKLEIGSVISIAEGLVGVVLARFTPSGRPNEIHYIVETMPVQAESGKTGKPKNRISVMNDFPEFMKNPANRISTTNQATPGVDGYVFDGADGSQMAFWTCHETATSAAHVHEFDEYMIVVQGCYTLVIDGRRIPISAGMEFVIPGGTPHSGEVLGGTRTIHAFGGHRADRARH